jgi:hypothetical protein
MNGDLIDSLPTDKVTHTEQQVKVANMLFQENKSLVNTITSELKDGIIICILFAIFSSTQVNNIILKNVPNSNNVLVLYGIKCLIIIILFYILKNFHLSRK